MKFGVFWKNPGYKKRPKLKENISCNYLIVGGGILGVSLAYFLAKNGADKIVLIEKHHIASGATGKAAGAIVLRGEIDFNDIIRKGGQKYAKFYWKQTHQALKILKKIIAEEKIKCDAEPQDTLYCGFKHKTYSSVHEEYELERSVEKTTKLLKKQELKQELNTELFSQGLLSANHGLSVNPLQLTQNFSKVVEKYGVKIYEDTPLLKYNENTAETEQGKIRFKKIILAIDAEHPTTDVKNLKTTIVITKPLTKQQIKQIGMKKKKIVFDAKKHYNYFKLTKDNRLLVGFGGIAVHKRHKKTDPHFPHLQQIKTFTQKLFPYLDIKFDRAWSGTMGATKDYHPFIEFKGNMIAAAGAASQLMCFMTAKHIADRLMKKKNLSILR